MRKLFAVLTLILCGYMGLYTVAAQGVTTVFSTTACSDEEKTAIMDTINLKVCTEEYFASGIQCFDVRDDGVYALAFGEGSNSRISVYDSDGSFQYGYKFVTDNPNSHNASYQEVNRGLYAYGFSRILDKCVHNSPYDH